MLDTNIPLQAEQRPVGGLIVESLLTAVEQAYFWTPTWRLAAINDLIPWTICWGFWMRNEISADSILLAGLRSTAARY